MRKSDSSGGNDMKYLLIFLSESSKIDFSGVEKLSKADHIIFLYVKGKKTLPASVKEALSDAKAEIEYFEVGASSEQWLAMAYLVGYHAASKHEVIVITEDKGKLPSKVTKDVKVYSALRSVTGSSSSSSSKKTTTAKKTAAKKTSTAKKTTATKKSTTAKKTSSTKKSSSKKKDEGLDVSSILNTIMDALGK